jgi:hypothetical protein
VVIKPLPFRIVEQEIKGFNLHSSIIHKV